MVSSEARRIGGSWSVQLEPFQDSARVRSLPDRRSYTPTAMHADEAQLTPSSRALVVPRGVAPPRSRHAEPFQDAVKGRSPAERAPKYCVGASCRPTATHTRGETHDTDARRLSPFGVGVRGGCAAQDPPVDVMASGTWTPYT